MTSGQDRASDAPMFSRDEILGGLPARRASGVVFAIEAHTARLVAGSRVSRTTYVGGRGAAEREQAFLAALAAGRDLPVTPTIQDLERFAPQWEHLAPDGAEARAAIALLFASKYRFSADRVPRLQAALGLDTPEVAAALARQAPDRSPYVTRLSFGERLAWRRAAVAQRLERLPPFWIAYALALTETITEGILVVPIAVAGIGPAAGVVVLLVLGILNLVTIGAQAEAITRNGSMRYGAAYFGRLVTELLGRAGSVSLSVALAFLNGIVLLVYLLGFASVLWGATGIAEEVWVLLLFAANAWVLRRESLDETVATALVIGATNITLIVVITAIAFANMDPANLAYRNLPFLDGEGIDPTVLQLVFGVIIVSYFGHTSAANASKLLLGRDPSGRAMLWGNLAALATVIVLYCLIVVAFAGALGPGPLTETRGTAITPLAEQVGPIVDVLGSIYVVLAVGLGSLYCSLGLYNQVVEYLPTRAQAAGGGSRSLFGTRAGRYLAGLAPTALVFLVLEYLLLTDQDWFAGPVALVGVLTIPLLGGVFPMLLVLAARRRGEYVPGTVIGVIGHPVTAAVVSVIFLGAIVLHATVIWTDPIPRALATGVSLLTAGLVVWILRGPAFRRAISIEIRDADRGASVEPAYNVVAAGRPGVAHVLMDGANGASEATAATGALHLAGLRSATFAMASPAAEDLRVWAHRVTSDGDSVPLAGTVELDGEGKGLSGGSASFSGIGSEALGVTFRPALEPER